jgi:hypothetical protein
MNFNVASNAGLKILTFSLGKISSSIKFKVFSRLSIGKLLPIDILDSMEHFIERLPNYIELFSISCHSKGIIEATVEEGIFSIKS